MESEWSSPLVQTGIPQILKPLFKEGTYGTKDLELWWIPLLRKRGGAR